MQVLLLVLHKKLVSASPSQFGAACPIQFPCQISLLRGSRFVGAKSPLPLFIESVEESTEQRATFQLEPTGATVPPQQLLTLSMPQLQEYSEPRVRLCCLSSIQVSKLKFSMPETPGFMRQKYDNTALTLRTFHVGKRGISICHQLSRGHIDHSSWIPQGSYRGSLRLEEQLH